MTTPTTWEQAKANFRAACIRLEQAADPHTAMEREQAASAGRAPTRDVTYLTQGFTVRNVTVSPTQETATLTRNNYGTDQLSEAVKCHPDYLAFGEDLAVWQAEHTALAQAQGWAVIDREWIEALDGQMDALRELFAFPVATTAEAIEKLAIAGESNSGISLDELDSYDLRILVKAIAADLGRVAGSAQA